MGKHASDVLGKKKNIQVKTKNYLFILKKKKNKIKLKKKTSTTVTGMSFVTWAREHHSLVFGFSIVFLLSVSALIVSILSKQRAISSDIVRCTHTNDTEVSMSLSAGKTLYRDVHRLTESYKSSMSVLTNVVDIVNAKLLMENNHVVTPVIDDGKVSVNNKSGAVSSVSFFLQDDVLSLLYNLNLVTTATGTSPTRITLDLQQVLPRETTLRSVSPVLCCSHNTDDVTSWQQVTPVIVDGSTIKLVNTDWQVTSRGTPFRLVFTVLTTTGKTDFR